MWIMTREGFFSAVEHKDGPDWLCVRARTEGDLTDLIKHLVEHGDVDEGEVVITTHPQADYRWRVKVSRGAFLNYIYASVQDIHYTTNVKGELDKGDPFRHGVLMQCWTALHRLQTGMLGYSAVEPPINWNAVLEELDTDSTIGMLEAERDFLHTLLQDVLEAEDNKAELVTKIRDTLDGAMFW